MKNILFIAFAIIGTSFAYSQTAVGIRVGSGSSGVSAIPTSGNRVAVQSVDDTKFKTYVVFDENENVVMAKDINATQNTTINTESLQAGFYYVAVVTENDEVAVDTYVKP